MRIQRIFALFIIKIIMIKSSVFCNPSTIFGIEPLRLHFDYAQILFDASLNDGERNRLCLQIDAFQIHLAIESNLALSDAFDEQKPRKSNRSAGRRAKLGLRREYEEAVRGKAEQNYALGTLSLVDVCKMWDFWLSVEDVNLLMSKVATSGGNLNSFNKRNFTRTVRFDCNIISDEQLALNDANQKWIKKLMQFVSTRHFNFLSKFFAEDALRKELDLRKWFDSERIEGENIFSYAMRTPNVRDDLNELGHVKRRMKLYLLTHERMDDLELLSPVIMAIDVIEELRLKAIFKALFEFLPNSKESAMHAIILEIALLYGKIWSYFIERRQSVGEEKNYLEKSLKLFCRILETLPKLTNDPFKFETNNLKKFYNFIEIMKKRFGEPGKAIQLRQKKLCQNYGKCLMEVYNESDKFKKNFQEKKEIRERLKRIFKLCDETNEVWKIFEDEYSLAEHPKDHQNPKTHSFIANLASTTSPLAPLSAISGPNKKIKKNEKQSKMRENIINNPVAYREYTVAIEEFCLQKIDSNTLVQRINNLFGQNPELAKDFNTFTSGEYKAKIQGHKIRIIPDGGKDSDALADEDGTTDALQNNTLSLDIAKTYVECPDKKSAAGDEISYVSKDPEVIILFTYYKMLLSNVEDEMSLSVGGSYRDFLEKLEVFSATWYYRESVRELFNFADSLPDKNGDFKRFLELFEEMLKVTSESQIEAEFELCRLHKFAFNFSTLPSLLNESKLWRDYIFGRINGIDRNSFDKKALVFLLPDDEAVWTNIDCNNAELVKRFGKKIREFPFIGHIHFFAMERLINQFDQTKYIFCHGTQWLTVPELKERLRWLVRESVLEALEAKFPEILHFELLNERSRIVTFTAQLSHKTGTTMAEAFEARLYIPELIITLKKFEQKLPKGKQKLGDLRKTFLERIAIEKNTFYSELANGDKSILRHSFCRLFHLTNFVKEWEGGNKRVENESEISHWSPKNCETEEGIRETLVKQRKSAKFELFSFLMGQTAINNNWLGQLIIKRPGARTRIAKLLDNRSMCEALLNTGHLTDRTVGSVIDDDKLLKKCYKTLFSNLTTKFENILKADIMVFVRWVDNKIKASTENDESVVVRRLSEVWFKNFRILFEEIFDFFYDMNLNSEELKTKIPHFLQFYADVKNYLERIFKGKMRGKSVKNISDELYEIASKKCPNFVKVFSVVPMCGGSVDDSEMNNKFDEWIRDRHFETLRELIETDSEFGMEFADEAEAAEDAADKLSAFLNNPRKAKYILKMMRGTENGAETQLQFVGPNAGDEKKRKCKKIRENANKSNAHKSEETPNVTNSDLDTISEGGEQKGETEASGGKSPIRSLDSANREVAKAGKSPIRSLDSANREVAKAWPSSPTANRGEESGGGGKRLEGAMVVGDFGDDEFLSLKYGQLLEALLKKQNIEATKTNESNRELAEYNVRTLLKLLDIGIYANELCHRLKALRQTVALIGQNESNKKETNELRQNWRRVKVAELSAKCECKGLEKQLHQMLKQSVQIMERMQGEASDGSARMEEAQVKWAKGQLHLTKLAFAIANGLLSESFWTDRIKKAICELFQAYSEDCAALVNQLVENVKSFKRMISQRKMDNHLYRQYYQNGKTNIADGGGPAQIAEGWQEIKIWQEQLTTTAQLDLIKSELFNASAEDEQNLQNLIVSFVEIVQNWSPAAHFQISQLHLLNKCNVRVIDSICVLPEGFSVESVLGKDLCNLSSLESREKCRDGSLHCLLCQNAEVSFLTKSWRDRLASIPLIKVHFMGVQMDIPIIIIPGISKLPPAKTFTAKQIDTFLSVLTINADKLLRADHLFDEGGYQSDRKWHEAEKKRLIQSLGRSDDVESVKIMREIGLLNRNCEMLSKNREQTLQQSDRLKHLMSMTRVLAEFGIYSKILELFNCCDGLILDQNECENCTNSVINTFRIVLSYLEQWAKGKHIYDGTMGYLEPKMLAVMLTKVFLLYPKASAPFLIDKFFFTYSFWEWAVPVQLAPIDRSRRAEFLSWSPGREWFSKKQFSPKNLRKIIGKEMAMAVITPTFPEQNAASQVNLSTAKVIRSEMIRAMKQLKNTPDIQRAIIKPLEKDKFTEKFNHFIVVTCAGPHFHIDKFCAFVGKRLRHELFEFVESPLAKWVRFCQVFPNWMDASKECVLPDPSEMCKKRWLVGIELVEPQKAIGNFKGKLRANLRKKIDVKIKKDFEKGLFYNLQLNSEYVEGRQMLDAAHWDIDLEDHFAEEI